MTRKELIRAAELLEANASALAAGSAVKLRNERIVWPAARAEKREHDDCLRLARKLRKEAATK